MQRLTYLVLLLMLISAVTVGAEVPEFQGELSSASAVLIDAATGQILFEKDAHIPMPPASVTKVMTMLLVMEALERGEISLQDTMITSQRAKSQGGTQLFLEMGESITVENALIGLAVESANDAAVVVAEHLAGSVEGFVELMNQRSRELGMENTNWANPTGLPEEGATGNMTTAYDIALMSRELLRHEEITKWSTIPWDTQFLGKVYITNKNLKFLRNYPGADGLKTGWTNEAGYCVSATAVRDGTRMIVATMKSPTPDLRLKDVTSLLNYGFAHYKTRWFHRQEDVLTTIPVEKGHEMMVEVRPADDVALLIEKHEGDDLESILTLPKRVTAPLKAGQVLGRVEILREGQVLKTVDLVAATDVEKANWFELFGRIFRNIFGTLR